jgi:hypothetical protein
MMDCRAVVLSRGVNGVQYLIFNQRPYS